jgi:hypothetical protein
MKTFNFAVGALFVFCGHATAATQGTASTTSSQGSFVVTMNGPVTPRTVQVLNVADITLNNASRAEIDAALPGSTMTFCVVDTYSGATQLIVQSANGANSFGWNAVSNDGAQTQSYYDLSITSAANTGSILGKNAAPSPSFGVPLAAGLAVGSTSACSSGNIKAHVVLRAAMPDSLPAKTYIDTITLIVTPQ